MSVELVIDQRERELKEHFCDKATIEMLDIGDILFRRDKKTILVIERKSVDDLSASICDGRSREQRARLLGSGIERNRIMYLIEGNILKKTRVNGGSATLVGSVINLLLRDGMMVHKTNNMEETKFFIERLHAKLQTDIESFWLGNESPKIQYEATLKAKKKDNVTPDLWFHMCLANIPSIQTNAVNAIIEKYGNLPSLLNAYNCVNESERDKMLVGLGGDNGRKIGPQISKRVYEYLHNIKQTE
jgi:ERCC4-type nuclease